ncbi:MAG: hypothetical protein LBE13_01435 [Bacteroidales bacterium]|jgi:hypothetical protein|nr:hypothetical protein [Bacteroidales bacterium]
MIDRSKSLYFNSSLCQIDNLAYRLYNLAYEEVRVIEPGFPLSKAEYEGIGTGKLL